MNAFQELKQTPQAEKVTLLIRSTGRNSCGRLYINPLTTTASIFGDTSDLTPPIYSGSVTANWPHGMAAVTGSLRSSMGS